MLVTFQAKYDTWRTREESSEKCYRVKIHTLSLEIIWISNFCRLAESFSMDWYLCRIVVMDIIQLMKLYQSFNLRNIKTKSFLEFPVLYSTLCRRIRQSEPLKQTYQPSCRQKFKSHLRERSYKRHLPPLRIFYLIGKSL